MLHIGTYSYYIHSVHIISPRNTMEISPWRCPGNRLDSTSGAATTCIKRFLCRPFTENNRIFSRDKNGSKCWVYGHMMSYDVICMAAFAGLWWFMLISCDINGWCIQILLVVGSTRYRITNSAPNGPAKRWSFWGSISLTDAHNVLHGTVRMQIQHTPMLDGLTRPQGPLWTQIGFIRDLEKEKTKMKRSHMLRSSQFCPGPGFIELLWWTPLTQDVRP